MSAQVEEVTASAQSLADMAHALDEVVAQFKLNQNSEALKTPPAKTVAIKSNGHKPAAQMVSRLS
jgi:hypothetical protein